MDLSIHKLPNPCNNLIIVDEKSDINLHNEVYKIAKYFSEDINYFGIPPYPLLGIKNKEDIALLFTAEVIDLDKTEPMSYRIFGSCYFSRQSFTKDNDCWALEWIWLHPFFRNKGNLKKYWPYLENNFGDFLIMGDVSNDMEAFLEHIESKNKHVLIP
jgi:hypothetical protein